MWIYWINLKSYGAIVIKEFFYSDEILRPRNFYRCGKDDVHVGIDWGSVWLYEHVNKSRVKGGISGWDYASFPMRHAYPTYPVTFLGNIFFLCIQHFHDLINGNLKHSSIKKNNNSAYIQDKKNIYIDPWIVLSVKHYIISPTMSKEMTLDPFGGYVYKFLILSYRLIN